MRITLTVSIALLLSLSAGCQTQLDQQQLQLIRAWGQANHAFATAIDTYQKELSGVIDGYIEYEQAAQQRVFEEFLCKNSIKGVLIETDQHDVPVFDEHGQVQPMEVDALRREVEYYIGQLKKLDEKREQWRETNQQLETAIAIFEQMNESGIATSEQIAKAKASAQSLLDASLGVLAGFASGIGAGLIIP